MIPKADYWRAIRAFCLGCSKSSPAVKNCTQSWCKLHPYRLGAHGTKIKGDDGKMNPLFRKTAIRMAIKAECAECLGTIIWENECLSPYCELYSLRARIQADLNARRVQANDSENLSEISTSPVGNP